MTKCYLNTSKSFICLITKPILDVHSLPSRGPCPLFKGLGQLVQKYFILNPHWALSGPTHIFRVLGFQKFSKAWIGSQLFNKVNMLMILGSLTTEKEFWIFIQKLGYVMTLWPNTFLQGLCILMILGSLDLIFFFLIFWMGPEFRVYHGFVNNLLSSFWIFLLD